MFVHKYIKVFNKCSFKMIHIKQSLEADHKYGQSYSHSNFPYIAPSEHLTDIIQIRDSQAK
jgi:hypothetical protein